MLAEVRFDGCRVPASARLGREGMGIPFVAETALHIGRLGVAMGSVGLIQACLDACLRYTSTRQQFGRALREHDLVRREITRMAVRLESARLLGYRAAARDDAQRPDAPHAVAMAKYYAAVTASEAANMAVQLHGANGISADYSLQRLLGDARVMEVIEGTTQLHERNLATYVYRQAPPLAPERPRTNGATHPTPVITAVSRSA